MEKKSGKIIITRIVFIFWLLRFGLMKNPSMGKTRNPQMS
jgi:hypothetical protein